MCLIPAFLRPLLLAAGDIRDPVSRGAVMDALLQSLMPPALVALSALCELLASQRIPRRLLAYRFGGLLSPPTTQSTRLPTVSPAAEVTFARGGRAEAGAAPTPSGAGRSGPAGRRPRGSPLTPEAKVAQVLATLVGAREYLFRGAPPAPIAHLVERMHGLGIDASRGLAHTLPRGAGGPDGIATHASSAHGRGAGVWPPPHTVWARAFQCPVGTMAPAWGSMEAAAMAIGRAAAVEGAGASAAAETPPRSARPRPTGPTPRAASRAPTPAHFPTKSTSPALSVLRLSPRAPFSVLHTVADPAGLAAR